MGVSTETQKSKTLAGKTFLQCSVSVCCLTSKQLTPRGHHTIGSKCLILREKNTGSLPRCLTALGLGLQMVARNTENSRKAPVGCEASWRNGGEAESEDVMQGAGGSWVPRWVKVTLGRMSSLYPAQTWALIPQQAFLKRLKPTKDFPGGPVVKTLCFHYRGRGFNLWSWN